MSALYRSITGQMECTVEGGKLFVRSYDIDGMRGDWEYKNFTVEVASVQQADAERIFDADRTKFNCSVLYYWTCILHCLQSRRPSAWYCEPKSEKLAAQIEELMRERDAALIAEVADRPRMASVEVMA